MNPLHASPKPEAPRAPEPPRDEDLDELDDLPPMDGDDDDPASDEATEDEELDDVDLAGDPYDDATGERDPVDDDEIEDEAESGWLEDANEAETLDIGMTELGAEHEGEKEDLLEGAEEPGVGEDDFSLGGDESQPGVDAGEEGFESEDEELREDELPRMDAGDDGEMDDAQLVDPWMLAPEDEARPAWSAQLWGPAGAPIQLGAGVVDAVTCAGRVVIAASASPPKLTRVDLEGGAEPIEALGLRGGEVRAVHASGARVVLATARAGVLVSTDGGATFTEGNGWRACVSRVDADAPLDVVARGEVLFGRTQSGALVKSGDGGVSWAALASAKAVLALGVDARGIDASALETRGVCGVARDGVARNIGQDESVAWTAAAALPDASVSAEASQDEPPIALAARGEHMAVCVPGRGVYRRVEEAWVRVEGTASASTCVLIDDSGTLLVALYSLAEERAWLAKCEAHEVHAKIVAEIGEASEESDARVHALVWDDAHGVAWAAGGFGLVALAPREERL